MTETPQQLLARLPKSNEPFVIHYTNWRGEYASRSIVPDFLWYGFTQWHLTPQWFLRALDTDRNAIRDFALAEIGQPPVPDLHRELAASLAREAALRDALTEVKRAGKARKSDSVDCMHSYYFFTASAALEVK